MERRALLAVAISVLILVLYQELILKRYYPPPSVPAPVLPEVAPAGNERIPQPQPAGMPPVQEAKPQPGGNESTTGGAEKPAGAGREVIVETDLYKAVFTTAGARLRSFRLKDYRTTVDPDSPSLDLLEGSQESSLPFGVTVRGPTQQVEDGKIQYTIDREHLHLEGDATGSLTFAAELEGMRVIKRLHARGDNYFLHLDLLVEGVAPTFTEMAFGWPKTIVSAKQDGKEIVFDSVVALQAGKVRREPFRGLAESLLMERDVRWFAYGGKYFLAALVPLIGDADPGTDNGVRVWAKRRDTILEAAVLLPPGRFESQFELYLGPKALDRLSGHTLRRAVDLGLFSFVALPLLQVLRLSHSLSGNYGIDIILLTIVIKILFFPLTRKSFRSMQEMQKLQPEMTRIRERFKDRPEEMNKEIMELYRRHKVNPLGGCLPMLLQMPVFIGLYQALLNSVELRHAGFVWWIDDLSAPDRLGSVHIPFVEPAGFPVLTLLMGASMVAQQWMTPATSADPTQQRLMMLMPVVFTFMFINFPSGLTLYWLVNNVLTIVQQFWISRAVPATR